MGCASDNYHCKLLLALFSELLENYVYYFKAASFVDELISKNNLLHEIIMISTSETSDMQENFLNTYKDSKLIGYVRIPLVRKRRFIVPVLYRIC